MSNFWQRALTGAVFVAVLVGCALGGRYSFLGLLFVVGTLGVREYAVLLQGRVLKPHVLTTMAAGVAILVAWCLIFLDIIPRNEEWMAAGIILAAIVLYATAEVILTPKMGLKNALIGLGGILYINIGLCAFANIAFLRYGGQCNIAWPYCSNMVIGYFILLWSSDTFAYLTGRAFGKTPLAPKISPKKTIEGSIGGMVCTMGISYLLYREIGLLEWYHWLGLAVVIVVFGTMGDLIESKFKRILDIKDSGNILPGHGGILDRFDSLLFSAPFAFVFLYVSLLLSLPS